MIKNITWKGIYWSCNCHNVYVLFGTHRKHIIHQILQFSVWPYDWPYEHVICVPVQIKWISSKYHLASIYIVRYSYVSTTFLYTLSIYHSMFLLKCTPSVYRINGNKEFCIFMRRLVILCFLQISISTSKMTTLNAMSFCIFFYS